MAEYFTPNDIIRFEKQIRRVQSERPMYLSKKRKRRVNKAKRKRG